MGSGLLDRRPMFEAPINLLFLNNLDRYHHQNKDNLVPTFHHNQTQSYVIRQEELTFAPK